MSLLLLLSNMSSIKVILPRPHPKQRDFLRSTAKRKVVVAGRRGGKTTGVGILACERGLAGKIVLYAAPIARQTDAFWRFVVGVLQPLVDAKIVTKNETDRSLAFWNGGRIDARTAHDPDSLRSGYADTIIFDEFQLLDPRAWSEVAAPMLVDTGGDAIFIFTPLRKNHAFRIYAQAQQECASENARWGAWHFTSMDNPHLDKTALAEIERDMTQNAYKQEILAQFLDDQGAVFRNLDSVLTATDITPVEVGGETIVAGIDWGRTNDATVVSVGSVERKQELEIVSWTGLPFSSQRERIENIYQYWNVTHSLAEYNSIGGPNVEALQELNMPVAAFVTTNESKNRIIDALALSFERETWKFLPHPGARVELESYESNVSRTGKITYSAPDGMHDDTVIARSLMHYAAQSARPVFL